MVIKYFKISEKNLELTVSLPVYKYLYGVLKNSRQFLAYSQRTDFRHLYVVDALKFYFLIYLATTNFREQAKKFNFSKKFFSGFISEGRCKTIKKALSEEKGIVDCFMNTVKDNDKWNTITSYNIPSNKLITRTIESISTQSDDSIQLDIELSQDALDYFKNV